ncbi:hypothetical protein G6F56_003642 [Rhizopus delemar]|nr:hypothetical protein G6F56_003642 [Rhizopus delemar]
MFSSLQFLKSSWVEHLKAACDIRKAYKIYERLFEDTLGTSIYDYDPSQPSRLQDPLEHGIYFGLGLFHLVISLLPTKVVKVLGQVKFRSVQSMSNDLLRKASESKTLYSSLASLVLLYYYAHRAMYLSPSPDQAEWIQHTLDRLKRTYSTSPLIALLEIKMTKTKSQLSQCLVRLKATKKIQCRMDEKGPIQSIKEYNVFRLLVLFEMGWLLVFSGHYTEAVETFFCLESTCHWSRLFYHFLSTCCMMAEGSFEKAGREIGQLIQMFEIKRKSGAALSPSEDYAEYKIKRWTETAKTREIPISELLRTQQPLWELVYLWNGVHLWSESLLEKIEQELANRQDPFAHLLLGVIYREKDPVLALAYFDSIVIQEREWVACALYEIALTHSLAGDKQRAADYLKRVVSNDFEWKMCMKIKCQFLFESLGK